MVRAPIVVKELCQRGAKVGPIWSDLPEIETLFTKQRVRNNVMICLDEILTRDILRHVHQWI